MHEYYAKKTSKLKKAMNGLLKPISGELNKYSGKPYADVFSEIWEHYKNRDILLREVKRKEYDGGDRA